MDAEGAARDEVEGAGIVDGDDKEYTVVFKAHSSARFAPDDGLELTFDVPSLGLSGLRVRAFTRWEGPTDGPLPRELVVECCGRAGDLDAAMRGFSGIARSLGTLIGFVGNVRVGSVEMHLAFESTPNSIDREMVEVHIPDERGLVAEGRVIRSDLVAAAFLAYVTRPADSLRLNRALHHYELALRNWQLGGEWLSLNHLWIAAENLTKLVVRKLMADRGRTQEELAYEFGVVTDDPCRPRWRDELGARVRAAHIFDDDRDTYRAANDASNGIEHGYWDLDKVAAHALRCTDLTFSYVRRTIVDLLDLEPAVADKLMAIKVKDVQSLRRVVRGRLVGIADDPAMPGERYPRLEWTVSIDSVDQDDSTFRFHQRDTITPRTHPDVGFQIERMEVRGRLEEGEATVNMSDAPGVQDRSISRAVRLLDQVVPLVDEATSSTAERAWTQASRFAFNCFGQGVACSQAAAALIRAGQPIEALPLLTGLLVTAARFEQMTEPSGPGLGVIVRVVLDSLNEVGADEDVTASAEARVKERLAGLAVPDTLAGPETTSLYQGLGAEVALAESVIRGTYTAVNMHVQRDATTATSTFHVAIPAGPLTDMVASAAVIAMLELLQHAASLLDMTYDQERTEAILGEARAINETSAARADLFPWSGSEPPGQTTAE